MTTRTPRKTTADQNLGMGVLFLLFSTVVAIFAANALRADITRNSVGLAMISVGVGVNGFIRLRDRNVENSWVAGGALLFAAAGLALMGMRVPQ